MANQTHALRHVKTTTADAIQVESDSQVTTAHGSGRNGQIITFYSYKGGVGRSRALANVAYQLAHDGRRVLCIDFDLEAPGLVSYFRKWMSESDDEISDQLGIIDIFQSYKEFMLLTNPFRTILDWRELVQTIEIDSSQKRALDFIGPGRQTNDYGKKVTGYDWEAFYDHWEGGRFIEHLRKQFRTHYDFVLIDSRTGVSDIGGICTIQFPTVLIVVFSSSPQSVQGLETILNSIKTQHKALRQDTVVPILPLPSRIDRQEESEEYRKWFSRLLNSNIAKLIDPLKGSEKISTILQRITINYFPWYAYHDVLESERESIDDIDANAWRFKNLISLIYKALIPFPVSEVLFTEGQDNVNDFLESLFSIPSSSHTPSRRMGIFIADEKMAHLVSEAVGEAKEDAKLRSYQYGITQNGITNGR